ncbi:MAG: SDR family NAD(P)-dependent oxidoreductase [Planctomycetota bacterium]|nr:MAG: SDR family NAD(P)-dependent oxidoreductase [Planctomycetota bacterium]
MNYWQGKVALVTGGSSGLGQAIARELCRQGAKVVIAARTADKLEAVAKELGAEAAGHGGDVLAVPADIRQQADVDALVKNTIERFGRLDALFNNAGSSARGSAIDTTAEEFADLMDLNVTALVRCTRAAMPHLLASQGHLVNIGSLAGKTAARYMGAYSATKHAVSAYSQQLRLELDSQGLHVLLVSPGPIARSEPRTYSEEKVASLPESARKPGGGAKVNLLQPAALAARILRACEKRQPELVVPGKARLVFAISQLWPSLGDWIIRKMT